MSKFNEMFTSTNETVKRDITQEQKDAFALESKENRQKCYQLADEMAVAVAQDPATFQLYLDMQSKFPRHSVNNALLLAKQMPEASQIGNGSYWFDKKVFIQKQELNHPILILEPGDEFRREDGSVGTYYNVKKVYDITQTKNGRHKEHANQFDINTLCMALASKSPVEFTSVASAQMPEGYAVMYDVNTNKIYMSDSLEDGNKVFQLTSMEIAHAIMAQNDPEYHRDDAHFNAYAASYLLCKQYGVPVNDFEFDLPLQVDSKEPQDIKKALSNIKIIAVEISSRMEPTLEKNKAAKEKSFER